MDIKVLMKIRDTPLDQISYEDVKPVLDEVREKTDEEKENVVGVARFGSSI